MDKIPIGPDSAKKIMMLMAILGINVVDEE